MTLPSYGGRREMTATRHTATLCACASFFHFVHLERERERERERFIKKETERESQRVFGITLQENLPHGEHGTTLHSKRNFLGKVALVLFRTT